MCEARAAAVLALAGLLAAAPVAGQAASDYGAHVARLHGEQQRLLAIAREADRYLPAGDTVRAGALTLIVPSALGALARSSAPLAWQLLEAKFGSKARLVAPLEIILQQRGVPAVSPRAPNAVVRAVTVPPEATSDVVAPILARIGAAAINTSQDSALQRWLPWTIDPRPQPPERYGEVYVELATAPWTAVRSCYAGDIAACGRALGLTVGANPLDSWYGIEDRRRLVDRASATWGLRRLPETRACLQQGDAAECDAALRTVPAEFVSPPLGGVARGLLTDVALELGGHGAYERLADGRGPIAARLVDAAGVPTDSLVRVWRARAFADAPRPITLRRAGAWAAMVWAVTFACLGLRSTRWR